MNSHAYRESVSGGKMRRLSVTFLILSLGVLAFAQTAAEVELLKQQISFLTNANAEMHATYNTTLESVKWLFGLLTGGSIAAFAVGIWQLNKNVKAMVEQRVSEKLKAVLENRLDPLEKAILREEVIGSTQVAYVHPHNDSGGQPPSFHLVQGRGFASVEYFKGTEYLNEKDDVVVLDLQFLDVRDDRRIRKFLTEAKGRLKKHQVCILFISPGSSVVTDMRKSWSSLGVANFPLSLISACVDASHLAYAFKHT